MTTEELEALAVQLQVFVGLRKLTRVTYRASFLQDPKEPYGSLFLGIDDEVWLFQVWRRRTYASKGPTIETSTSAHTLTDEYLLGMEDTLVITPLDMMVMIHTRKHGIYIVDEKPHPNNKGPVICEINPDDGVLIWKPHGYTPSWWADEQQAEQTFK